MLPRRSRIPRADFAEIQKSRRFKSAEHLSLRVAPHAGVAKAAVSVSKKVSKSAVARNRVRRRAYAVLRDEMKTLAPGLYLFVAKSGADKIRGEVLRSEIASLLNEA